MTVLRPELPPLPENMKDVPIDERGYPVPYFVAWVQGPDGRLRPDHRVADAGKKQACLSYRRCWLCGKSISIYQAFAIGPMCIVNRVTAEPGSHKECAVFAIKACPFLTRPDSRRRDSGIPSGVNEPAGVSCPRNPGVIALWVTRSPKQWRINNGVLIRLGEPLECSFWAEGRPATRAEILESINTGLPQLEKLCESEADRRLLAEQTAEAMRLVPA